MGKPPTFFQAQDNDQQASYFSPQASNTQGSPNNHQANNLQSKAISRCKERMGYSQAKLWSPRLPPNFQASYLSP
jgi:hypothetical protein